MSQQLLVRSRDLSRLLAEGYDVEVRGAYLLLKAVPYVAPDRQVRRGTLVTDLVMAGPYEVGTMTDHTVFFTGECPCDATGRRLDAIVISSERRALRDGLIANHHLSSKPVGTGKYASYFDKMTAYVRMIEGHAKALDPSADARTGAVAESIDDSPFEYPDTASSRAGIAHVTPKLAGTRVAIVGVGGSGAYVLDLVAKTPVREIHLFDGDVFYSHNAFRAPGAATAGELSAKPSKVEYFATMYARMHRGIVPHLAYIDATNVDHLRGMDFVFLCMDPGPAKRLVIEALEQNGTAFIDVGMGLELVDDSLSGVVRVTTSTPAKRDHVRSRVSFAATSEEDVYDRNIQVADLNALAASMAVIRWKKHAGVYLDFAHEHNTSFAISTNALISDDSA